MSSALPIRDPDPPGDTYVTVAEAVALTGLTACTWTRRAQRESARGLAHLGPPPGGKGKAVWWVSRTLDSRLLPLPSGEGRGEGTRPGEGSPRCESLSAKHPAHLADAANRRLHWLKRWQELIDDPPFPGMNAKRLAARVVTEAKRVEGDHYKISVRSLQIWKSLYAADGIDGLVPRYGPPPGSPHRARSDQAVDFFHSLYRVQSKPSIALCHEATVAQSRIDGHAWPGGIGATRRWLRNHDDLSLSHLLREGKVSWTKKFMPYNEIDYTLIQPGALYVCDHTQCDFWVDDGGTQIRPWLTAIQDARSRVIVGRHLGASPNQDAIVAALHGAFRDWAIPGSMRIDNGKDFTSKRITGLTKTELRRLRRELGDDWKRMLDRERNAFLDINTTDRRWLGITGELGIKLIYAIPYAAWSKGTIERWFGTFHGRCGKTFATYCGNSPMNKPECVDQIRRGYDPARRRALQKKHGKSWRQAAILDLVDTADVPTMEQARERIDAFIGDYHKRPHSAEDLGGRSPIEVWNTATSLRKAVDDELVCLMNIRGLYRVGPNGVRVTVGGETIGYGARAAALTPFKGRDVLIAVDGDAPGYAWAFTADDPEKRKPIARLAANERISPLANETTLREASAAIARDRRVMHQAERSAVKRTRTFTQRVNRLASTGQLAATGTDDAVARASASEIANVVPVSTGFKDASTPTRNVVDPSPQCEDTEDISDLFDDEAAVEEVADDEIEFDDFLPDAPDAGDDVCSLDEFL